MDPDQHATARAVKPIHLALQGGGAHGALTWGVLDRLLEDRRLEIRAISGTSAGAMNAVVLADGFAEGGREGARAALRTFWTRRRRGWRGCRRCGAGHGTGGAGATASTARSATCSSKGLRGWSRRYGLNPLGFDPLREILARQVDFDRVNAGGSACTWRRPTCAPGCRGSSPATRSPPTR